MTFSNNIQGSDERTVDRVHTIIKDLVRKGEIKKERIDESYDRIMKLKSRLAQEDQTIFYQHALEESNRKLEEARREIQFIKEKAEVNAVEPVDKKEVQEAPPKKKKRKDKS
jgi:beta-N-acetylhexosaminidase